jgi:hypothetical protein
LQDAGEFELSASLSMDILKRRMDARKPKDMRSRNISFIFKFNSSEYIARKPLPQAA